MWNISKENFISAFHGRGFLGVRLEWSPLKEIVDVYAPCQPLAKRALWADISVEKHARWQTFGVAGRTSIPLERRRGEKWWEMC